MKKNISINIGGIIFHIEEDGYEKLKNYLDSVNTYFSSFEDSKEIIEDIEGRIAEIFLARLDEGKQVISKEDVDDLIKIMGTTKDFDATIESEEPEPKAEEKAEEEPEQQKTKEEKKDKTLYRDTKRRVVGGVASGIANYLGIDSIWVRLIILAFLFNWFFAPISGFVFIAYIILWVALPGNDHLEEDKAVKKLYRDSEDRVFGGVCSGIAAYFGVDRSVIRILFIVITIFYGAGLLAYLILWIIVPEAKTITEKMQMQGEPVTLSNIEENVKKSLNVKEGEENAVVKILLFPFRLIAIIFKALGEALGPLLKFSVEALRIIAGVLLAFIGITTIIALTISLVVLLGIGGALENWAQFGNLPTAYLIDSLSFWTLLAAYFVSVVPAFAIVLIGFTIIMKKAVVKAYVGWSLFGIWFLGTIILAFSIPSIVRDFSAENSFTEEKVYAVSDFTPTFMLNEIERDYQGKYRGVELRLRGHSDSTYLLVMDVESRGASRAKAKDNAEAVDYNVSQRGEEFFFDSRLSFPEGTPFRFQQLEATFYIPYGKVFRMDGDLADILINTLHLNGYRAYQMEGNDWVFDDDGIRCITCEEDTPRGFSYKSEKDGSIQVYEFDNFDEVSLISLFDFEIRKGDEYQVILEGKERFLDDVLVTQRGDELEISLEGDWKWWKKSNWDQRIKVFIEMPELDYLLVRGACEGDVVGFDNDEISLKIDGASEVTLDVEIEKMKADLAGASELTLIGSADYLEAEVIGASELKGFNFEADEAEVRALGASTVRINVRKELAAEASGASTIRYRGNPRVSEDSKGLSSIKRD